MCCGVVFGVKLIQSRSVLNMSALPYPVGVGHKAGQLVVVMLVCTSPHDILGLLDWDVAHIRMCIHTCCSSSVFVAEWLCLSGVLTLQNLSLCQLQDLQGCCGRIIRTTSSVCIWHWQHYLIQPWCFVTILSLTLCRMPHSHTLLLKLPQISMSCIACCNLYLDTTSDMRILFIKRHNPHRPMAGRKLICITTR